MLTKQQANELLGLVENVRLASWEYSQAINVWARSQSKEDYEKVNKTRIAETQAFTSLTAAIRSQAGK